MANIPTNYNILMLYTLYTILSSYTLINLIKEPFGNCEVVQNVSNCSEIQKAYFLTFFLKLILVRKRTNEAGALI